MYLTSTDQTSPTRVFSKVIFDCKLYLEFPTSPPNDYVYLPPFEIHLPLPIRYPTFTFFVVPDILILTYRHKPPCHLLTQLFIRRPNTKIAFHYRRVYPIY